MRDRDRITDWFLRPGRTALLGMGLALLATDQALYRAPEGVLYSGLLDETAHFLTGALVLATLRGYVGRTFAVGLLVSSVLIDIDHVPGLFGIDWITHLTPRPYSHSLLTIAVVGVLALVWRSRRLLLLGVILGLAFHFFRDMSEPVASGVALFWPWGYRSYASPHWIYLVAMGAALAMALYRATDERTLVGWCVPRSRPHAAKPGCPASREVNSGRNQICRRDASSGR